MENVADIYTLSPVQLGMLFHTLANADTGVYVNQYTCKLSGHLQPDVFKQAWQQTLGRHPVLRTAFLWDGLDEPLQVVRQRVELPWQELDWRGMDAAEQRAKLDGVLECDRTQGFNLDQAPLLRFTLIHLWDNTYQFIWSSHHLLFDGWSLPLIWQDMLTYYGALRQATVSHLTPHLTPNLTPIRPYRDYIAWQQAQDLSTTESFWRHQLNGFTEPTPLPAARPGTAKRYRQQTKTLSPALTTALKTFGRQHQFTLNTLIQAAWALLLSHYSGKTQVIYGSVVSGRPAEISGVETMVGLFINTLPVRVVVASEQSLVDWLQVRQQQLLDLRQYEATPLSDIQRWSDLPKGSPLFESIVVFENYPTAAATDFGFNTSDIRYLEQSNYPLALLVVPGESLELLLLFDPGRFEEGAIANLHTHLELLLTAFIEHPHAKLAELPRLTPSEKQQLTTWQTMEYPRDLTIHQLIEAQVQRTPDTPAVVFEAQTLTYRELDQQANQLANRLRSHGVAANERVALCLHPSLARIVSILAVLKAGGTYVPLDPTYPAARIHYCLEDTKPKLLLTQSAVVLPNTSVPLIYLDQESDQESDQALNHVSDQTLNQALNQETQTPARPQDLAYIIYTSGSTGNPKGVMVSHRNLVHSTVARSHVYPEPVGRFLLLSSIAFDSSVAGIFWTLCQGGTLVLPPQRIEQDLQQLVRLMAQQQITHTLCVPTLYSLLLETAEPQQLAKLRTVIVAGEACPRMLVKHHYAQLPATDLYNEYGPTEATVWCTAYRVPKEPTPGPIAIGHAIPNTQIYILDEHLQPVPTGAIGEIYIGGDGVTQGYLNQPQKTAAAFITPGDGLSSFPISHSPLYKTGDLARYRANGTLVWLGRCDRQVKIRGHRIELGEIEDALQDQAQVQEAVVVAHAMPQSAASVENLVTALATLEPEKAESLLATIEEHSDGS